MIGVAIDADDIVERRLEVGVAQAIGDDAVDVRQLPIDGMGAVDSNDGPDANRGIKRGPEVKLVRRVGAPFGGHHATERDSLFLAGYWSPVSGHLMRVTERDLLCVHRKACSKLFDPRLPWGEGWIEPPHRRSMPDAASQVPLFFTFAQESRSPTVRLNTSAPA